MEAGAEPEELVYEVVSVRTGGELELLADNVQSLAGVALNIDMEEIRHENVSGINAAGSDAWLFEGGHTRIGAAPSRQYRAWDIHGCGRGDDRTGRNQATSPCMWILRPYSAKPRRHFSLRR